MFSRKNKSSSVAKDRLKALLVTDRISCTPDTFHKIHTDLFQTLSKYVEIIPEEFDVKMTRTYIHIRLTGEDL